jgi:hypothetical protein
MSLGPRAELSAIGEKPAQPYPLEFTGADEEILATQVKRSAYGYAP